MNPPPIRRLFELSARGGFYYLLRIANLLGTLAALLLLLLPGTLFLRRDEWERGEPIELVGIAFGCSAAFWAVSFWAARFIPVSLRAVAAGAMAASLVLTLVLRRGARRERPASRRSESSAPLAQLGFLLLLVTLRLSFAATHVAYSGGDMTAHAATSEEIVMADGFPATQEPLMPIRRFGEIPPGFHVLSALVTIFSGLPTYRSTIVVFCLATAAMSFALYALLRALNLPPLASAAGAAGSLLLARNPQFFLQWGGAPSILAAAIGLVLFRDVLSFGGENAAGTPWRAGLLAAAVLLVHPLPAVGLLWILPAALLLQGFSGAASWRGLARDAGIAAAVAIVLALPFLAVAPRSTPEAVAWAPGWFQAETRGAVALQNRFLPILGSSAGPATWPFYLVAYLGALAVLFLVGGILTAAFGPRREAFAIAILVLLLDAVLFAGALKQWLPGWPLLYPTRTGLWLVIPLAIGMAEIASWIRWPRSFSLAAGILFACVFGLEGWRLSASRFGTAFYGDAKNGRGSVFSVLANEAAGGAFWVTTFCRDTAAVTAQDLDAFTWIRAHTPPDSVFANNPGDGGCLLPAAAHRKVLEPHYYWFFDSADFRSWRVHARGDYVFVGAQPAPAWERHWTEELDSDRQVELCFRSGRARVYRVKPGRESIFR